MQAGCKLIPVEFKLTATPGPSHCDPLRKLRALIGENGCEPGFLVCRVTEERPLPFGVTALPWQLFPGRIRALLGAATGERTKG